MDILSFQIQSSEQFWEELHEIVYREYQSTSLVERGISAILRLVSEYLDVYLDTDDNLIRFVTVFIDSNIFSKSRGYVRRKLISLLLVEGLHMDLQCQLFVGTILLVDGRQHLSTLEMIQEEAGANVLLQICLYHRCHSMRLNRIFLELLYETCRVQKIQRCDLSKVNMQVVEFLFSLIEEQSDYDHDPHGFAAIKVLLALNEQYMIQALECPDEDDDDEPRRPLRNVTFDVLRSDMNKYRSFGENIVVFFNRVNDKCLQLMMMKFLYLIFTTKETYQYIYLNDLKVLVDIIFRELTDMSDEEEVLRHTYLRILYPLLKNTQLQEDCYKRREITVVLEQLAYPSTPSFNSMSETTHKLAAKCLSVQWLEWAPPSYSSSPQTIKEEIAPSTRSRKASIATIESSVSIESGLSTDSSEDSSRLHVVGLVAEDSHLRNYCPTKPAPPPPRYSPLIRRVSSSGYFSLRHNGSDIDVATLARLEKSSTGPRRGSPCPPPPLPRGSRERFLPTDTKILPPAPPPPRRPRTTTPSI